MMTMATHRKAKTRRCGVPIRSLIMGVAFFGSTFRGLISYAAVHDFIDMAEIDDFLISAQLQQSSQIDPNHGDKSPVIESSTNQDHSVAVFYNIFVTKNLGKKQLSNDEILPEQFRQVQDSFLANRHDDNSPLNIYYNTVNAPPNETIRRIEEVYCASNNMRCRHLRHFPPGTFEEGTLQTIHDYCMEHSNHTVVHIHNKGSLNKRDGNASFRRALTDAATSRECFHAMTGSSVSCGICGLLMSTAPFFYINGNMWHAKCTHIQKLLPVSLFGPRMEHTRETLKELIDRGILTDRLYEQGVPPWLVGGKRYTWEHWQTSHPSSTVCDVASTVRDIKKWRGNRPNVPFQLQQGPVPPTLLKYTKQYPDPNRTILNDPIARKFDFALLPGFMVKFASVYGVLPPLDHWIWNHYPDGGYWRDRFALLCRKSNVTVDDILGILKADKER